MHYGSEHFAKNKESPTIVAKNCGSESECKKVTARLGQRVAESEGDQHELYNQYQCKTKMPRWLDRMTCEDHIFKDGDENEKYDCESEDYDCEYMDKIPCCKCGGGYQVRMYASD